MLETAPSEVASRFPRNCRASQPVSKPWKLPIFSSRAARAPARQSACTCRAHILPVCGLHVGWGAVYTVPVILFTHTQNNMHMSIYLSDRSHRTAGWVAAAHVVMYMSCDMYVLQMCTARLCGSHKNHSPSRPVVNWRSLNLYIALLRSRLRGAAIADRRHEVLVGGVLSASAVPGEQCNR